MSYRIGHGYDSHVFDEDCTLKLAGVEIPGAPGLRSHSDGDCALHALCDALLGAAALGDIGQQFPPEDPLYQNTNSAVFVEKCMELIRHHQLKLVNLDITLIAEQPQLSPHIPSMREQLVEMTHLKIDCVNVKATTNEGMDAVGRREGIAAHAVVLLHDVKMNFAIE